jgi:hypothetical protein
MGPRVRRRGVPVADHWSEDASAPYADRHGWRAWAVAIATLVNASATAQLGARTVTLQAPASARALRPSTSALTSAPRSRRGPEK